MAISKDAEKIYTMVGVVYATVIELVIDNPPMHRHEHPHFPKEDNELI